MMWKRYVVPLARPVTTTLVAAGPSWPKPIQSSVVATEYSITYAVMADPPSNAGGDQLSETKASPGVDEMPSGGPGTIGGGGQSGGSWSVPEAKTSSVSR